MTNRLALNHPRQNKIQIVLDHNREMVKVKELPSKKVENSSMNPSIQEKFNRIVQKLDRLVGLNEIKKLIFEIFALINISYHRTTYGLKSESQVFHMIFKGNPGTGKTTVARIMANMFMEMGLLSKGHLVEVERADLVGEYIGHTAQKTREQVNNALGGILFIDEAYSLYRGGDKDFGRESIDVLVKAMEDHKNDFILILAGYSYEMDSFIHANPGLYSRFPIQLNFEDYTIEQLLEIAEVMIKERDYDLSTAAKDRMKQMLMEEKANPLRNFSNARLVRNWVEKAIRNQAVRLISDHDVPNSKQILMTIQSEDFIFTRKSISNHF